MSDKEYLNDHYNDLLHEEAIATCEHEDYTITSIDNVRTHDLRGHKMKEPVVEVEVTCDFCGKTNYGELPLEQVLDLLNNFLYDYRLNCTIQDDGAWG